MNTGPFMQLLGAAVALSLLASAARAEVVVVVSAASPTAALSVAQVVDIFLGKSNRFPDGRPAVPLDQAEGSPERVEFYATYSDKTPAQMKMHWSKLIFTGRGRPPASAQDSSAVKKLLAADPAAIGYMDRSAVDETVKVLGSAVAISGNASRAAGTSPRVPYAVDGPHSDPAATSDDSHFRSSSVIRSRAALNPIGFST